MRIPCICVDDTNQPKEIPNNKWIKKDTKYHITHIYLQKNQNNIKGVALAEIFLDDLCAPYETFKLSRFAIHIDDLSNLVKLAELCTGLNDVDIHKLLE